LKKRIVFVGKKPGVLGLLGLARAELFPLGRMSGISRVFVVCRACKKQFEVEPETWGKTRMVVLSKPFKCPFCGARNVAELEEID